MVNADKAFQRNKVTKFKLFIWYVLIDMVMWSFRIIMEEM